MACVQLRGGGLETPLRTQRIFDFVTRFAPTTALRLQLVNPNAEVIRRAQALTINMQAATGLAEVMRTNLGKRTPERNPPVLPD